MSAARKVKSWDGGGQPIQLTQHLIRGGQGVGEFRMERLKHFTLEIAAF